MKTWAVHYDECKSCHSTTFPHHAKGLCTSCYHRQYQRKSKPTRHNDLERLAKDLPTILRDLGLMGVAVTYSNGSITFRKIGTKTSITWPQD